MSQCGILAFWPLMAHSYNPVDLTFHHHHPFPFLDQVRGLEEDNNLLRQRLANALFRIDNLGNENVSRDSFECA